MCRLRRRGYHIQRRDLWRRVVCLLCVRRKDSHDGDAMKCTATTRLTAEQCLARLAECPALPRGERLQWATPSSNLWNRAMRHRSQWYGSMLRPVLWSFAVTAGSTVSQEALDVCWARWRTIAAPVRRMRDERRALRAKASALAVALEAVLTGFHGEEFLLGARWMAAGWAVCEFLSDLAAQVNAPAWTHGRSQPHPLQAHGPPACRTPPGPPARPRTKI